MAIKATKLTYSASESFEFSFTYFTVMVGRKGGNSIRFLCCLFSVSIPIIMANVPVNVFYAKKRRRNDNSGKLLSPTTCNAN